MRINGRSAIRFFKISFFVVLSLVLIYFVLYHLLTPRFSHDDIRIRYPDSFRMIDPEGRAVPYQADQRYDFDEDGTFTLRGTLPDTIYDGEYLGYFSFYDSRVWLEDSLVWEYSLNEDARIPGGAVKTVFHFVPLESDYAGREMTVQFLRSASGKCRAPELIIGSGSDIYRLMFKKYGAAFVIGLTLLVFSLVLVFFSFLMQRRTRQPAHIIWISIAAFMTAGWIVTDSNYYPFAMGHNHIDGIISYLLCMLLPAPYLFYLSSLQKDRWRKAYLIMQGLTFAVFIACTALHAAGAVPFNDSLVLIDTMLVGMIVAIAWILFREWRSGKIRSYRYTALGLVGFMLFGFGEIFIILSPNRVNTGELILFGLMFLLAFAIAQQLEDTRIAVLERQKALELSDAKTAFLAGMSHEIRTPINSILGMNELILRENTDPVIASYAGTVRRSGKMLMSLINDVLDFSRIESGELEIIPNDYRLSELLVDISAIAREQAEQKGLDFELRISGEIPDGLNSDDVRIKQILLNLISNAVKYTDKGRVAILVGGEYTSDTEFALNIAVEDTGRGIRSEDQATLFEAFKRSDMEKNRSIEGTGLGLAIVKRTVDAMKGTVTVKSEYRHGSVFSVMLPQAVRDRTPVPARLGDVRPVTAPSQRGAGRTAPEALILAVDDNRPNLSIVRAFLKDTQIRIDLCTNGNDALACCRRDRYDLILLDHMMPDPDGVQTLKMIRTDPDSRNHDTPAVVLTANAVSGSRQMYLDAGFADYLAKPLDAAVLENLVWKYIPAEKIRALPDPAEIKAARPTVSEDPLAGGEIMEFEAYMEEENRAPALPDEIRHMPGLDFDAAIRNMGGSEELLAEILADITAKAPEAVRTLRQHAENRDYDAYRIKAHSMKSLMATIGAHELSETAKAHEFAALEQNEEFIRANYMVFSNRYEAFCAGIAAAFR